MKIDRETSGREREDGREEDEDERMEREMREGFILNDDEDDDPGVCAKRGARDDMSDSGHLRVLTRRRG